MNELISEVQEICRQWRSQNHKYSPVPEDIKQKVVACLRQHSVTHLCQVTGFSKPTLKAWAQKTQGDSNYPSIIEIDPTIFSTEQDNKGSAPEPVAKSLTATIRIGDNICVTVSSDWLTDTAKFLGVLSKEVA